MPGFSPDLHCLAWRDSPPVGDVFIGAPVPQVPYGHLGLFICDPFGSVDTADISPMMVAISEYPLSRPFLGNIAYWAKPEEAQEK
jgi:hypothetical protein